MKDICNLLDIKILRRMIELYIANSKKIRGRVFVLMVILCFFKYLLIILDQTRGTVIIHCFVTL